jgi:hypothetical protein
MNMQELIEHAEQQVSYYKSPDLDEFREKVGPIFEAAKLGNFTRDCIDDISTSNGELRIETSYSCRGCAMDHTYRIPLSVVYAEDPIATAKKWGIDSKVAEHRRYIAEKQSSIDWCLKEIAKLEAELETK